MAAVDSKLASILFYLITSLLLFIPACSSLLCRGAEGILLGDVSFFREGVGSAPGGGSVGCAGLARACAHSDSFCFLSTLPASLLEEDDCAVLGSAGGMDTVERIRGPSDGRKVCCSWTGGMDRMDGGISDGNGIRRQHDGPMPPASWVLGDTDTGLESASVVDSQLAGHVDIQPPSLDWGTEHLYSPSFAYLTVTNMHNASVLHIHRPYSSDPQFYPHDFDKLSLAPGEAADIQFVFLPRGLGSLTAHIVLQTSFGGFIVNAVGVSVESPFQVESLVGLEFSGNGRVAKGLSLFNPFDEVVVVEEVVLWHSRLSVNESDYLRVSCQSTMNPIDCTHDEHYAQESLHYATGDGYNDLRVEIRHRGKWEILPHESEVILDMTMVAYMVGSITGVICVHLKHFSGGSNKIETIILPLELKNHRNFGHHATNGVISIFVDPLPPSYYGMQILVMSLRNDALELLSVSKIADDEHRKLFGIKYVKDLLVYPGSLTHIALLKCPSFFEREDGSIRILKENSDCKLCVKINSSSSPVICIPCQDIQHACSTQIPASHFVDLDDPDKRLEFQHEKRSDMASTSSTSVNTEKILIKSKFLKTLDGNEFILRNWRSQGSSCEHTVLEETELIFPKVELGRECSKWIHVKNPSEKPVVMQLILNPEAIVHNCKLTDDVLQHSIGQIPLPKSMESKHGFILPGSAITEAFVNPSESITLGPIVFRPDGRCMWSSSVLIKNNLSGIEWLPIRGTGTSNFMVIFEGSRAIQQLDFSLNWSLPHDISFLEREFQQNSRSLTCAKLLFKELRVKNVGEIPFEVVKLQVSGTGCELGGFTVHTCKGFALSPGESARLLVSYQPDFTSSVVNQNLELTMPSGMIVIPMKANVPHLMVKLCQKSWSFFRILLSLALIGICLAGLYSLMPSAVFGKRTDIVSNSNSLATINNIGKTARIHRHPRNVRSPKDELKSGVVTGRYSDGQANTQSGTSTVQLKQEDMDQTKQEDMDHHERDRVISACSEPTFKGERGSCIASFPMSTDLTIKIGREKGKRRKRRTSGLGTGVTSKLEACSSHSGNSTPSSPMSPNSFTPKQVHHLSPDPINSAYVKDSVERSQEKHNCGSSPHGKKHHVLGSCHDNPQYVPTSVKTVSVQTQRPTPKPILTPSATFPSAGCRSPGVALPMTLASTASPTIPLYARAPGSNLRKGTIVKAAEEQTLSNEFTYDIWGNHLSDHIMGRSKGQSPRAFTEASEGESQSFFAIGPHPYEDANQ